MNRLGWALLCCLALSAVSGCGIKAVKPPSTVPVSGVVLWKGKPVEGVVVKFHPRFNIGRIKFIPLGETGRDGKFTLNTGAAGNGAPPGDYAVTFEKPRIVTDQENSGIELEVDDFEGQFSAPEDSLWLVTVNRQNPELEAFELE